MVEKEVVGVHIPESASYLNCRFVTLSGEVVRVTSMFAVTESTKDAVNVHIGEHVSLHLSEQDAADLAEALEAVVADVRAQNAARRTA